MSSHDSNDSDPKSLQNTKKRGWVSLRQFAQVADISYPTALRWCRLKMIVWEPHGGTKRVYQDELARYLREGTLPPDPEELAKEKAKREDYKQNGILQRKDALKRSGY